MPSARENFESNIWRAFNASETARPIPMRSDVIDVLTGKYSDQLKPIDGSKFIHRLRQNGLASYIANGWVTLEQGLRLILDKSGDRLHTHIGGHKGFTPDWKTYVESQKDLPISMVEVSSADFTRLGFNLINDRVDQTRALIYWAFPQLKDIYHVIPEAFEFRYVCADADREAKYGDVKQNIIDYGVDFDLSKGWKGIWTANGTLWNSLNPPRRDVYLLIYFDPEKLLGGPGFYDEGALDFIRLVLAGKTLKDLLADGGVLRISNNEEI